jgi:hypothetical protein
VDRFLVYSGMKKRIYLQYIRIKYIQLTAQYLTELTQGRSLTLLKALNGILTTLAIEKAEYEEYCHAKARRRN